MAPLLCSLPPLYLSVPVVHLNPGDLALAELLKCHILCKVSFDPLVSQNEGLPPPGSTTLSACLCHGNHQQVFVIISVSRASLCDDCSEDSGWKRGPGGGYCHQAGKGNASPCGKAVLRRWRDLKTPSPSTHHLCAHGDTLEALKELGLGRFHGSGSKPGCSSLSCRKGRKSLLTGGPWGIQLSVVTASCPLVSTYI